jgi:ABC-type polysaccharide/polyol phosphate transport system ATPase subunit
MTPAITVDGVSKRYQLGEDVMATTLRDAARRLGRRAAKGHREELWALRDITLDIAEGEVVGIIGRNGAGKSTLLKLFTRISEPTEGVVRTWGRVGALLEVGTGFHPELTGRENVMLNGAVLGMTRGDVRRRFDEIVAFAGVERFLDTPLKRYSSGMQLRLAFAVAAFLEPEILVIDEVLAVGDAEFQRRCLRRMSDFTREGRTVVFVSHDHGALARLCPRAIWLEGGRIREDGPTPEILPRYLRGVVREGHRVEFGPAPGPVGLSAVEVTGPPDHPEPRRDLALLITIEVELTEPFPGLNVAVYLSTPGGPRVLDEAWTDAPDAGPMPSEPGRYALELVVPPLLAAGEYVANVWMGRPGEELVDAEALRFRLHPRVDDPHEAANRARLVQPEVRWTAKLVDRLAGR